MRKFYFTSAILMGMLSARAQYTQNFNSLTDTGTSAYGNLPLGWAIYEVGSGQAVDGKYAVGTGSINTGNVYSFGNAAGDNERALGTLSSGSNFPTIGALFVNQTNSPITSVTISYTGKQWRYGGRSTGIPDTLRFEYSTDATGIVASTASWTRLHQLDFLSVVSNGEDSTGTSLDGNAPENNLAITYTITGVNIDPGQSLVLRWTDKDIAGFDDGLSVDDFSISAGLEPGVIASGETLPVTLTNFGGVVSNRKALLQWNTATEINASHFVVERSGNREQFAAKGTVNATGAGAYHFTDEAPADGVNYYRLKQVDKDGKADYSQVIMLELNSRGSFSITPNPSHGNVRISNAQPSAKKTAVYITDAAGKGVYYKTYNAGPPIDLNLSFLSNGTYIVRVNEKAGKLIIQK